MIEKVLCIIPARGGSKGVKRKNVRELNGKPMIAWSIDAAKKSKYVDKVVVSTEDAEIGAVSKSFGAEVIERPSNLAEDKSSVIDVFFQVLEVLKEQEYIPKYIMLLQCTSPLRTSKHVDEAIEKFFANIDCADSLISITKEEHPPWWMKKIDSDGFMVDAIDYDKKVWTRRQDFPQVYKLNGAIYIIKTEKFYEHKKFETERTIPYVMDSIYSIDVDTEFDFVVADFISSYLGQK